MSSNITLLDSQQLSYSLSLTHTTKDRKTSVYMKAHKEK
jgi:hypothetical protein